MKLCGLLVGFLALDEAAVRSAVPWIFTCCSYFVQTWWLCTIPSQPPLFCFFVLLWFFWSGETSLRISIKTELVLRKNVAAKKITFCSCGTIFFPFCLGYEKPQTTPLQPIEMYFCLGQFILKYLFTWSIFVRNMRLRVKPAGRSSWGSRFNSFKWWEGRRSFSLCVLSDAEVKRKGRGRWRVWRWQWTACVRQKQEV